jgi:hypothetical protein
MREEVNLKKIAKDIGGEVKRIFSAYGPDGHDNYSYYADKLRRFLNKLYNDLATMVQQGVTDGRDLVIIEGAVASFEDALGKVDKDFKKTDGDRTYHEFHWIWQETLWKECQNYREDIEKVRKLVQEAEGRQEKAKDEAGSNMRSPAVSDLAPTGESSNPSSVPQSDDASSVKTDQTRDLTEDGGPLGA